MDNIQNKVNSATQAQPESVSQLAYICYFASFFSIILSILLWFLPADTAEKKERGERIAIFVGLWPPTLAIVGKVVEDRARAAGATR